MTPTLTAITFDCRDSGKLAAFWSELLALPVDDVAIPGYATIPGSPSWAFIEVPEEKSAKNRVHVDLGVTDLEAGIAHAEAVGATRHGDFDEAGFRWTTFTDPEGNEFDIVATA